MNKIFTYLTLLLVLCANVVSAQSWTVYHADVLPNDASLARPFVTASGNYNAVENMIVVDPDKAGNNLLQMDISPSTGTGQTQFYWRMRFDTDPVINFSEITVVFRAKGNPDRAMGLDLDIQYGASRSRVSLFNGTNLADIRNGTGSDVTLDVNVADWNTYRFTMSTTETKLYVNENAEPSLVFVPAAVTPSATSHFRFGDGDGSNTMGALIDWVTYDVTGSYSPTQSPLPAELINEPEEPAANWIVYNADVAPLEFDPAFVTSSHVTPINEILVDPSNAENSLLRMATAEVAHNNMWRQNFSERENLTVVVRAKGVDGSKNMIFDMDFDFRSSYAPEAEGVRKRWQLRILPNGTGQIVNAATDNGTTFSLGSGVDPMDWNIYRFVWKDFGNETALYVNENPVPVYTGVGQDGTHASNKYFRFGDGLSTGNLDTHFDWVVWDYTGAFSPLEQALPEALTQAPLGDWTVYEADIAPLSFSPAFVASSHATPINEILVDADDANNNLLRMATAEVAHNNMWRQNTTERENLTIVVKAKGVDVTKNMIFDMDFDFRSSYAPDPEGVRKRWQLRILPDGTGQIVNAATENGTTFSLGSGVNPMDWNIYRFVWKDFGNETSLYVNENPVAVYTGAGQDGTHASNKYFRFGDGLSTGNMDTYFDWVVWDVTGAYSPAETRLPDHLTGGGGEVEETPTISAIGTVAPLSQDLGFASDNTVGSYTVSGSDLTGDITITPPTNFEVSLNEADWFTNANPLVLARVAGVVESTTIYVRLNANAVGDYAGNITHTSTGAEDKTVAVSGATVDLVPELSMVGTLSAFTQNLSNPSASQNYRVSGVNLKSAITVTSPANFQVSADNSTWSSEITLEPTGRTITNVFVYVRLSAASLGSYNGSISHTANDATTITQAVTGQVVPDPGITAVGTFTAFSQSLGAPSAPQSYTVSGSNLTSGIAITLPAGYQISFTGDLWLNSLTLSPLNGNVQAITLFVRLNASSEGSHGGEIVHASTGLNNVVLNMTGTTTAVSLSLSPDESPITIWPNPSSNKITFERKEYAKDGKVTLYSLGGATINSYTIKSGSTLLEIDINSLPTGLYVMEYGNDENIVRQKFIKK